MQDMVLETFKKEYSLLESIEYLGDRPSPDTEFSSLISNFHLLFFDTFKSQLINTETYKTFKEIEDYCIKNIKIQHIKSTKLNYKEFYVWHLSMFMLIQTFISISRSKYSIEQEKEIKDLFDKLTDQNFHEFLDLNSKKLHTDNLQEKLYDVLVKDNLYYFISKSSKMDFSGESYNFGLDTELNIKYPKNKNQLYAIL